MVKSTHLRLHAVLALLVVAVWGFNFVMIKVGLNDFPPLFLAFTRFFLTSVPAIFFVKRPAAPISMIIGYALAMFVLQFGLLYLGMDAGAPPGLSSILMQLHIFFTIVLAVLIFGEKVHVWQIVGAFVAFSGIVLVAMNVGSGITLAGFLLLIAAAAAWSAGNVISKKIGRVDMASLVIWGSFCAWPPLLALSWFVEGPEKIAYALHQATPIAVTAVLYIAYLSNLFGFGVWSFLLHHHPLATVAPFTLLVPILAILFSVFFLGEPLQVWKICAALLVIAGLCINLFGPRLFSRKNN